MPHKTPVQPVKFTRNSTATITAFNHGEWNGVPLWSHIDCTRWQSGLPDTYAWYTAAGVRGSRDLQRRAGTGTDTEDCFNQIRRAVLELRRVIDALKQVEETTT